MRIPTISHAKAVTEIHHQTLPRTTDSRRRAGGGPSEGRSLPKAPYRGTGIDRNALADSESGKTHPTGTWQEIV